MTHPDLLKIAAIKAILDAIEDGDAKDAAVALEMIRAIINPAPAKQA